MNYFKIGVFVLIVIRLFCSCSKDSMEVKPTFYIQVINPQLSVLSATQGTNSHNITDAWLYINDIFYGCVAFNTNIPIFVNGNIKFTIKAGVKMNGISASRQSYVLYTPYTEYINCEANKIYTISPKFENEPKTNFILNETFEAIGTLFTSAGDTVYSKTDPATPSQAFGGTGQSAVMKMSSYKPQLKMISANTYNLPLGGAYVYLELNYKCNQAFEAGIYANGEFRPVVIINATADWKKIYIDLRNAVNTTPVYQGYNIYFQATKIVSNPEILVDNIKVMSY